MEQGDIQEDSMCYKRSSVNHMLSSIHMFPLYLNEPSLDSGSPRSICGEEEGTEAAVFPIRMISSCCWTALDRMRRDCIRKPLELLYGCGLRVSEVCELRINQVHLEQGYLRVIGGG